MPDIPSLAVLRSFEAAARHQSFTRAAEELRVTQGAVSRMVRDLEAAIGVSLFRPEGRGVALTEAGRNLAVRVSGDLDRLRQTMQNANSAGDHGQVLAIGVLPTFGARWLAPRLVRFQERHPHVQFALHSRSQPFDLAREGIDLAIHFGRKEWVGGSITDLCPEDLVVVASPALRDRFELATPADIARCPLLHLKTRETAWKSFFDHSAIPQEHARGGSYFDQFSTMVSATIHGLGAAILPSYLIESELAAGTLVALSAAPQPDDRYFVVTPKGVQNTLAQSFREWITKEAQISARDRAA